MYGYLERYDSDGFLVTDPLFRTEEIEAISRSVDELCARAVRDGSMTDSCVFERDQPREKRGGVEVGDDETAVFIVGDAPRFCPKLLPAILNEKLLDLVYDILGTREIVTHFANITSKAARIGSGINWHRDYPNKFISPISPDMVRTMICIDGMSAENGATTFLRGSHRTPNLPASSLQTTAKNIVSATCEPGGITAIHPLVLHGGPPNFSSLPRRNIVVQWSRKDVPLATSNTESITGKTVQELHAMAGSD